MPLNSETSSFQRGSAKDSLLLFVVYRCFLFRLVCWFKKIWAPTWNSSLVLSWCWRVLAFDETTNNISKHTKTHRQKKHTVSKKGRSTSRLMRSIFPLVGLKASSGFSAVIRAAKQWTWQAVGELQKSTRWMKGIYICRSNKIAAFGQIPKFNEIYKSAFHVMFKIKERNEFTQGLKSFPCPFNFSRRDDGMNFKMHLGSALLASVWFRCTCKCNKTDLSRMLDESVSRINQYWLTLPQNFVCKNLFKPVAVPIWDVRHRVVAAGGDRGIKHTPPTSAIPDFTFKIGNESLTIKANWATIYLVQLWFSNPSL